jgi:hypothetical protein
MRRPKGPTTEQFYAAVRKYEKWIWQGRTSGALRIIADKAEWRGVTWSRKALDVALKNQCVTNDGLESLAPPNCDIQFGVDDLGFNRITIQIAFPEGNYVRHFSARCAAYRFLKNLSPLMLQLYRGSMIRSR